MQPTYPLWTFPIVAMVYLTTTVIADRMFRKRYPHAWQVRSALFSISLATVIITIGQYVRFQSLGWDTFLPGLIWFGLFSLLIFVSWWVERRSHNHE